MNSTHKGIYTQYKKIIISLFILITSTLLSGCGIKGGNKFEYEFEGIKGGFFTDSQYGNFDGELNGLGYRLINNNVIKTYAQTDNTGFTSSIIISKSSSEKELSDFVQSNIKLVGIEGFKAEQTKESNFLCGKTKIPLILVKFRVKTNSSTIYFGELYFQKDEFIYIVSFASTDEDERNNFIDGKNNLTCTNII